MKSYVLFNVLKSVEPIGNKLREFNEQLRGNEESQSIALLDAEINGPLLLLWSVMTGICRRWVEPCVRRGAEDRSWSEGVLDATRSRSVDKNGPVPSG